MVQNKKRIISLILMLTLLVSSLVIGAITASAAEETATISFASTAQRVSQDSNTQVWKNGDVTFTNNKASSSTAVANYSNPVRLYDGSSITIQAPGRITKIVFQCNSTKYATALIASAGSEATANGNQITLTLTTPAESYTITELTAQVRLNSLTVTYEATSGCAHDNTTTDTNPATCTTAGSEVVTCDDCDAVVSTKPIAALGHEYESDVCSRCGNIKPSTTTVTVTIGDYASANNWQNGTKYTSVKIDENITVTANGGGNTGKYYTSGSNWRIYQSENGTFQIKAATEIIIVSVKISYSLSDGGQLTYNNSGYTTGSEIVIGKNSAVFGVANTRGETNGQVRITSIEVVYCDHNKAVTTSTATCTTSGKETVVCGCGYTTSKDVPATGHSFTNYVSNGDATCTADGTETGKCTCGAEHTRVDEDSKLEHTERTPATCTAQAVCDVCGTSYGELAAHEYFYSCDAHCKNCGELTNEDASHTPVHVEATAPICTENGNVEYWYCSDCGSAWLDVDYTIQTNLKAVVLGATCATNAVHNEGVEAGCTTTGLIENWYCANCDVYYLDAACTIVTNYKNLTIPTLNHNTDGVVAHKDATCTEAGVEGGTYCTRCGNGKAAAEATIPATGHATEVEYWTYNNKLYLVPVCGCLTEKVLVDTTNALPVANEEDLVFLVTHGFNVVLDADINLTKTLDIEGTIVTINLNGKTLKADWESDDLVEVIHVHDASHLTIVGEGNVISGGQYKAATNSVISCRVYSQLTIKGGNYYSASYGDVIFCETSSIVHIEGGHFEAATDYLGTWYVLDIDETETYNRGKFIVTGGTFVNFNPANHTNDGKDYTNKVAPGYITTKDADGNYVVSEFKAPTDPTEKVTISNPFTLAEDVILNGELVIKNGAVIDLNGCTIESSAVITFNGTIIDTVGTGKIIVNIDSETNKPMLQIAKGNYDYAPIHIETKDGKSTYAITPVKVQGVTAELSNTAVVRPSLKGNVYTNQALFAPTGDQKVIPHGITFALLVTRDNGVVSEDAYVSLDNIDLTQLYADNKHAIKITLKGGLEGYTYTVKFVVKSADTQVHVSDVIATRTVPVKPKEEIIPETTND